MGANPIGIIIPCHRVIGANGNLTGYAGGLVSKVNLLKLEGIDTDKLIMPKKSRFRIQSFIYWPAVSGHGQVILKKRSIL